MAPRAVQGGAGRSGVLRGWRLAGLPGRLEPVNAGYYARSNAAGYLDLQTTPTQEWTVNLASRYESHTDFGSTRTCRFSTRYDSSPRFALHATVGNGFRAPSLAQSSFPNVNVSPTGASGLLAAGSPAAKIAVAVAAAGGRHLAARGSR